MNHQSVCLELEKVLKLKGYSPNAIESYVSHVRKLLDYHGKDLSMISSEDINEYILYLLEQKKCSASYVNTSISAIKFMENNVLRRKYINININIFRVKKEKKLPDILSQEEVTKILNVVENSKHKALLSLVYSAGLRVSEVVRLKIEDIDSIRMLIHVRDAKGKKDRYTLLSEKH